jgi:L-asparaginase/Glu-tRNA(Gln) amidotransferase subunit D
VHDKKYDAFKSPAVTSVGQITSGGVELSEFFHSFIGDREVSSPKFTTGVTMLEISPTMPEGIITLVAQAEENQVLILKALGEGNVPRRLITEIKTQARQGKIIVLSSSFAGGSVGRSVYELGAEAIKAGAIPTRHMTQQTIRVKCSWLVANGITERAEFAGKLQTNYVGEISED